MIFSVLFCTALEWNECQPFPLKKSAVPADDLLPTIARELAEALAGVHDGVVGQRGVCEDEVLLRDHQRLHQAVVGLHQDAHLTAALALQR